MNIYRTPRNRGTIKLNVFRNQATPEVRLDCGIAIVESVDL